MDRDIVDRPHQLVDDRAVPHLEPPGTRRLADDDLCRARLSRKAAQPFDDARGGHRCGRGAQPRRQRERIGQLTAIRIRHRLAAPRFDINRSPWRAQRIGEPFACAHQLGSDRQFADSHDNPFADRKTARQRMAAHMLQHLRIDGLCGAAKRQFAQRGQVRFREKMRQRARRFLRDIDFAVAQPLDQFVGRNVDDLDLGIFEDRVGHRFANADAREGCDDVIQALDVLDVDRRIDIDPRIQQFFDVLIALGMATARCVAVRQFIDQNEPRPPLEDRVDIHLAKAVPLMVDTTARDDLMPVDERFGLAPPMRLDHANDDVDSRLAPLAAVGEHLPRLADAGRRAEKHFQTAAAFLRRLAQEGLWRWTVGLGHAAGLAPNASSRRLSLNRLTRASPMSPRNGVSTACSTSLRTAVRSSERTRAMRST